LGVVLGNVLQGMPLNANMEYTSSWLAFLNPYAIMVGITTVALFMMHGAIYLIMKTEGRLYTKLSILLKRAIIFFIISFAITTVYSLIYYPHLSDKFRAIPVLFVIPLLAFLSIANIPRLVTKKKYLQSFIFSALSVSLLLITVAIELYPVVILSTSDIANSITIYNAAASQKSLGIMLTIAAIGTPLVLGYTAFVFWTFKGKVRLDEHSY